MNPMRVASVALIVAAAAGLSGCQAWGPYHGGMGGHHGGHQDMHGGSRNMDGQGDDGRHGPPDSTRETPRCDDDPDTDAPPCGDR